MAFAPTEIRNHIPARKVRPIDANKFRAALDSTVDVDGALGELSRVGINVSPHTVSQMMAAMDDSGSLSLQTLPSAITPIQFLQHWLPGFVHVVTAARKIDQLIGITAAGSWEDEEIIQGVMEPTARAVPYTDWGNVPYSGYNANFQRRHIVRFEQGSLLGGWKNSALLAPGSIRLRRSATPRPCNSKSSGTGWASTATTPGPT